MSLQFLDGAFAYIQTSDLPARWTSKVGTPTITAGLLQCGSSASTTAAKLTQSLSSAQATVFANVRFQYDASFTTSTSNAANSQATNTLVLISFYDAGSVQCSLVLLASGKLQFCRGTTLIGSPSTATLSINTKYDLEVKVTISDAAGVAECQINGAADIVGSSLDTKSTANATADSVHIGSGVSIASGPNFKYDHAIIFDSGGSTFNTHIGIVNVNSHFPTANGATNNFARGGADSGANWSQVEESPANGDTDYVASSTLNDIDLYEITAMPVGVTTIKAVALIWNAKRDDAATRGLSPVIRHTTNFVGTNQNVGASYAYFTQIYEQNPGTSAAFVPGEFGVGADQFGIKVTT